MHLYIVSSYHVAYTYILECVIEGLLVTKTQTGFCFLFLCKMQIVDDPKFWYQDSACIFPFSCFTFHWKTEWGLIFKLARLPNTQTKSVSKLGGSLNSYFCVALLLKVQQPCKIIFRLFTLSFSAVRDGKSDFWQKLPQATGLEKCKMLHNGLKFRD